MVEQIKEKHENEMKCYGIKSELHPVLFVINCAENATD